jgi:lysophospholipase L1-like esterase
MAISGRLQDLADLLGGLAEEIRHDLPDAPDVSLPDGLDADLVYMAIGASDAVGIGATPPTDGYVFRIEDAIDDRDTDVRLVNVGVPGAELDTIHDAAQLALRVGPEPDLATVWVGANDLIEGVAAEEFEQNLDQLLDDLADTGAVIAVADLPDLTELPRFREDPRATVTEARIDAFNEAIRSQAESHGALLVALSEEQVEDRFVSDADGFHPNDAGHARIADLFLEAIEPELDADPPTMSASQIDLIA